MNAEPDRPCRERRTGRQPYSVRSKLAVLDADPAASSLSNAIGAGVLRSPARRRLALASRARRQPGCRARRCWAAALLTGDQLLGHPLERRRPDPRAGRRATARGPLRPGGRAARKEWQFLERTAIGVGSSSPAAVRGASGGGRCREPAVGGGWPRRRRVDALKPRWRHPGGLVGRYALLGLWRTV